MMWARHRRTLWVVGDVWIALKKNSVGGGLCGHSPEEDLCG